MNTARIYTITPNAKKENEVGTAIIRTGRNLLKDFYKILNCDYVNRVVVNIGNKKYDIWFDEDAKIKATPAAILWLGPLNENGDYLCNSIIITNHLTDEKPLFSLNILDLNVLDKWVHESREKLLKAYRHGIMKNRYA